MRGNMADPILVIHEKDNVAVALRDIEAGEEIRFGNGPSITALESIPASHKIALRDLAQGEKVIKYGEIVGTTTMPVKKGSWVHGHNMGAADG